MSKDFGVRSARKSRNLSEETRKSLLSLITNESGQQRASLYMTAEADSHWATTSTTTTTTVEAVESEWGADVLRTAVQCLDALQLSAPDATEPNSSSSSYTSLSQKQPGTRPSTPVVRPSSTTSTQRPTSTRESTISQSSSSTQGIVKENSPAAMYLERHYHQQQIAQCPPLKRDKDKPSSSPSSTRSSRKIPNRLASKVGGLHRDAVVQGIRSIFR
jgi:hypothetical protein